jgi:hypothetical protein
MRDDETNWLFVFLLIAFASYVIGLLGLAIFYFI